MRKLSLALTAAAAVAATASSAMAADLLVRPEATPVINNSYVNDSVWNGAYAGLSLSGQTDSVYGLGANLGVNALVDSNLLVGLEGSVTWLNNDSWEGQVNGKAGFAIGNVAFYGLAGFGYNNKSEAYAPIGVGAEVALNDAISLKAEYQYQYDFSSSAEDAHVAKVGFNFHF